MPRMHLLPHDERYFGLFDDLAEHMVAVAMLQRDLFADLTRGTTLLPTIRQRRQSAGEVVVDTLSLATESLITPVEPGDIVRIAYQLDGIVDLIENTCRRTKILTVARARAPAVQMCDVIVEATSVVADSVMCLREPRVARDVAAETAALDELGGTLHHAAIEQLFAGDLPALEILTWKDLFDGLSAAATACDTASNGLVDVALRHS